MSNSKITQITGRAIPVRGNDIDTDRIIPARFLRCVTFEGIEAHAFEDDRKDPSHAFNNSKYRDASILICNKNFGCGSSREHAPQSLVRWGIKGFIGESFAEIFFGNCISLGVPCIVVSQQIAEQLLSAIERDPSLSVSIDVENSKITAGQKSHTGLIPPGTSQQLLTGAWDALGQLLEAESEIKKTAAALPY